MDLFSMLSLGNLENGDVIKLFKENNSLPSGALIKMEGDKALSLKGNKETGTIDIGTVNTVVNGEEMFASMSKEKAQELIKILMEVVSQL